MSHHIGLIGCGAIGNSLASFIQKSISHHAQLSYVFDQDKKLTEKFRRRYKNVKVLNSISEIVRCSDFVIEAASPQAASKLIEVCSRHKRPALLMSGGGLVLNNSLLKKAQTSQNKFYLPSGAIPGIDGLLAGKEAGLKEVMLTTSKSLRSLKGAPFFDNFPEALKFRGDKKVIFEGNVRQAIRYFPKNLNVAALLAITGLGAAKTKVKLVAFKRLSRNIHEIIIKSKAGEITLQTKNVPHPDNPRTSALAIYSAQALLRKLFSSLSLGT